MGVVIVVNVIDDVIMTSSLLSLQCPNRFAVAMFTTG